MPLPGFATANAAVDAAAAIPKIAPSFKHFDLSMFVAPVAPGPAARRSSAGGRLTGGYSQAARVSQGEELIIGRSKPDVRPTIKPDENPQRLLPAESARLAA